MSNPNDPIPTPPDPNDPERENPSRTGHSSFEFALPGDGNGPPPVAPPAPEESALTHTPVVPSRPPAGRHPTAADGTFDFIDLPPVADAGVTPAESHGLTPVFPSDASIQLPSLDGSGEPPPEVPPDLPPVGLAAAGTDEPPVFEVVPEIPEVVPEDDAVTFEQEVPTADPASFTMGGEVFDLGEVDLAELLPDAEPVSDVVPEMPSEESAVDVGTSARPGNLEPVSPASGWLDSDVMAGPSPVVPVGPGAGSSDILGGGDSGLGAGIPVAGEVIESSDIFSSGAGVKAAELTEFSDVIAATAGVPTAGSARPSDVALDFNAPPGGSTTADSGASDLPMAAELSDSSIQGAMPVPDAESIHDLPDPAGGVEPFDSARFAEAPELPVVGAWTAEPQPGADTPDYGSAPRAGAEESSILADLTEPHEATSGDSSSVRVEAPGIDRTLTGAPSDDLTLADDVLPAEVAFDMPSDATADESTDWQQQSGSNLFADRTAPDIDLGDDRVEAVDLGLTPEQPSLTSAPSSIFSGGAPKSGSGGSGSGGTAEELPVADEELAEFAEGSEEVEFSAHPVDGTAERDTVPARPVVKASSADFELPDPGAAQDKGDGAIDWDAAALAEGDEATRGIPQDPSLSAIIRGELMDDSAESPTRQARPVTPTGVEDSAPGVTVDWLAGSVEEAAVTVNEADQEASPERDREEVEPTLVKEKPSRSTRGARVSRVSDADWAEEAGAASTAATRAERAEKKQKPKAEKPAKKGGGMVVGVLLGAVLTGGALAGAYYGDLIPRKDQPAAQNPPAKVPDTTTPPDKKNPDGTTNPPPPQPGAATARDALVAGDIAKALELVNAKPPETTADKALAGRVRVFAKVQELGRTNAATAAADDPDLGQARNELRAAIKETENPKTPAEEKLAVQAAIDLGLSYEVAGDLPAARKVYADAQMRFEKSPKLAAIFTALLDRLDTPPAPGGTSLLTPADAERILFAVMLLADPPAKADDDDEAGLYFWKAVNLAARGDYKGAGDQIVKAKAAHIKRAKALAGRGLNPLTDPLEQMFPRCCDELKAYWELRATVYGKLADGIKADGLEKTLDSLLKAKADLATAQTTVTNLQKDVTDLRGDLKKVQEKLDTTATALTASEKKAKDSTDLLAAVVVELSPAVKLPEKWTDAELIAATKSVTARATGPDLRDLIPKGMIAAGGGLSTAQLLDLANRVRTSEAAAKEAKDKLASETKRLTTEYEAKLDKLTIDNKTAVEKLKTDHAAELKKATDTAAADIKKLKDSHADETAKLKDSHAVAIKAEQDKTEEAKKETVRQKIAHDKVLANVYTPAQALDMWLPLLTDLRRPADADPAMATAAKALAGSAPDSEEAAKARTVTGMALLLKGDLAGAKEQFTAVKRSQAYKAAAGKAMWAKVADTGYEATEDPLALYRQPVEVPPRDPRAAAQSLDQGIRAYRAGRFADAAKSLSDAGQHDPTNPVTWYFLGAAQWAMGNTEEAKKNIAQGALREETSPVPGRTISAALSPIQGTVRDAIDRARP